MASVFCRFHSISSRLIKKGDGRFKKYLTPNCISVLPYRNVSKVPVGFIGLGQMGSHMARNLIEKGHSLVVYDVYPEAMTKLADHGAIIAQHPAEVSEKCDRIISMLPSSPHVQEVYTGENGILQQVKPGTLLVDSSTIDPAVSQEIGTLVENKSAVFLDAPVSGGVIAAKDGTLTFMVGGKKTEYQAARELLLCMGKNVIHCGDIGTGQAAKICNNMALAISMIGTAESMNLGIRLGLEAKLLAQIINSSSGRCWSSEVYNPVPGVIETVPSSNNYEGGFSTSLMTKDLGLAQSASTRTITPTPLGSLAHQIFRLMINNGYGSKDFSSVFKFLQEGN
ncbi:3-hydroxyisobutyrate dehydrogenase, mitochondrial-like [Centruroides sculpturatus]|uniref:3-hydroxyisobutyrate dehydrogenase, mitochondrial-like n=2 Tax=Centruroides sculpturatus TaxID=218467 RepID=UPI000C6E070D|nr:3-hydroxyisobutyrate dehydrogenase, mitochondrial-like [Centruroides sculpturatus]